MRPCARLPQLGTPFGAGSERSERVSHVPSGGALRATVAGLWTGLLRGHRCAHTCLRSMWTRVLGEVSQVLGGDPSTPWHPCISRCLPLLCHPAQPHSGLLQANLPGPCGLSWRVLLRQRRLNRNANMLWNCSDYFMLSFVHVSQLWKGASSGHVLWILCNREPLQMFRASCGCLNGHCGIQRCGAPRTTNAWLLQNEILFQLSCKPNALNRAPAPGRLIYNACWFSSEGSNIKVAQRIARFYSWTRLNQISEQVWLVLFKERKRGRVYSLLPGGVRDRF